MRQAVSQLRLAPIMFETGASPHPARSLYQSYLAQSHVFIGVYWQSYGWVAPGMDVSGLEDEFRLATGKPRLVSGRRLPGSAATPTRRSVSCRRPCGSSRRSRTGNTVF